MHGSVKEWCYDFYGDYSEGEVINPIGPLQGSMEYYGVEVFTEVHMSADPLLEINLILHGEGLRLDLE